MRYKFDVASLRAGVASSYDVSSNVSVSAGVGTTHLDLFFDADKNLFCLPPSDVATRESKDFKFGLTLKFQ